MTGFILKYASRWLLEKLGHLAIHGVLASPRSKFHLDLLHAVAEEIDRRAQDDDQSASE